MPLPCERLIKTIPCQYEWNFASSIWSAQCSSCNEISHKSTHAANHSPVIHDARSLFSKTLFLRKSIAPHSTVSFCFHTPFFHSDTLLFYLTLKGKVGGFRCHKECPSSWWRAHIENWAKGNGCSDSFRSMFPHAGPQYKETHNWMISYSEQ